MTTSSLWALSWKCPTITRVESTITVSKLAKVSTPLSTLTMAAKMFLLVALVHTIWIVYSQRCGELRKRIRLVAGPTCRHGFPSLNAAAAEEALKFSGSRYILFYYLFWIQKRFCASEGGRFCAKRNDPTKFSCLACSKGSEEVQTCGGE